MELLANKLRPKKLCDVIGQEHLIGEGAIINNLVKNKVLFSMILYGPPGTGKTSIANAIIGELNKNYRFWGCYKIKYKLWNVRTVWIYS